MFAHGARRARPSSPRRCAPHVTTARRTTGEILMSTHTAVRLSFAKRKQGDATAHVRVAGRGSIFEPLRTRGPRASDVHMASALHAENNVVDRARMSAAQAAVLAAREAAEAQTLKAIVLSMLGVRSR